ncbi:DUF3027 domain-containing protein [Nocardioides sp. ChNu-99]|nr:DUF3027 domain-containing protein [Nocardioides sp. ChNu-99]
MIGPVTPTTTTAATTVAAAAPAGVDSTLARAVDVARAALLEQVDAADVGDHLGCHAEGDRVATHAFACLRPGYRGWHWSVTVARASRQRTATVDEVVLTPGDEAIVAPPWVPWRERVRPGDLGPGDLLPVDDDDPRLVPTYSFGDDPIDDDTRTQVRRVARELGLGRVRTLSPEGRDLAAQRWYDGDGGPSTPLAASAPAACTTCGFLVRLAGPLSEMFGVCANANANDDGRVVSLDHGCGAHSEVQIAKKHLPAPLPDPVVDTITLEDLERF